VEATILAVDNHLMTRHEALAENGRDFDDIYPVLKDEHAKMLELQAGKDSLSRGSGAAGTESSSSASNGGPADNADNGNADEKTAE
jgi:hypothetical protein